MSKLNLQKLATTLSGRERAKLMITSWHEAIIGKQTFSEADKNALVKFEKYQEGREFRYFMCLYKHGYFILKDCIEEIFLKIVALTIHLNQFHSAFGVDMVLRSALRALGNVPTFISEAEFKQKREEELNKRTELIVCLANHETNALLNTKHWLGEWEPNSTLAELEQDFGFEWVKTFWEQVERIRSLIKEGKLQSASITDNEKGYSEVIITKIEDAITTKSWMEYSDRHDKNYQPYLETDELYAISYNPDEVDDKPFEPHMREQALELCKKLTVVNINYKDGLELLTINESSKLMQHPQETLRALEQQIQRLATYKAVVEHLEEDLGIPMFDAKSSEHIREEYDHAAKVISSHNEFIDMLEKPSNPYIKIQLVDKEKYLLKALPILTETFEETTKEIKDLAEHETNIYYR
jgi:hypothetical protein